MNTVHLKAFGILLLTVLSSCYKNYSSFQGSINDIPLPDEKEEEVQLFFGNEFPQNKPFIKIAYLEVRGSKKEEYDDLLSKVKAKAQQIGYDAVIYITPQTKVTENNSWIRQLLNGEQENEVLPVTALTGVGVKYIENLEHLTRIPQNQKIYLDTSIIKQPGNLIAEISFDYWGQFRQSEYHLRRYAHYYSNYIRPFSLFFLLKDEKPWKYKTDKSGRIKKRKLISTLGEEWVCRFHYNSEGNIAKLYLQEALRSKRFAIELNYQNDRIIEEVVRKDGKPYMKIFVEYDERGRIRTTKHWVHQQVYIPLLETEYEYYSLDDLRKRAEEQTGM
ncbi:hypothetical protein AAG747_14590 [Rapidithrix thailandica]|uniref:Uncharacterized protein n=1 Tax=Rapidithrix thailandica TaxID=413964 RepID=A0AAW9S9M2_9BACT